MTIEILSVDNILTNGQHLQNTNLYFCQSYHVEWHIYVDGNSVEINQFIRLLFQWIL